MDFISTKNTESEISIKLKLEIHLKSDKVRSTKSLEDGNPPEARAGVDDPVAGRLLPHALLHQRLLRAEQLHGQLVVGGRKDVLQLALDPPGAPRLGGDGISEENRERSNE